MDVFFHVVVLMPSVHRPLNVDGGEWSDKRRHVGRVQSRARPEIKDPVRPGWIQNSIDSSREQYRYREGSSNAFSRSIGYVWMPIRGHRMWSTCRLSSILDFAMVWYWATLAKLFSVRTPTDANE